MKIKWRWIILRQDSSGTRNVGTAKDKCIVHCIEVNSYGACHISIDAQNNFRVSGSAIHNFDKSKGGKYNVAASGTVLASHPSVGYGGYGGHMDQKVFPLAGWAPFEIGYSQTIEWSEEWRLRFFYTKDWTEI